METESQKIIERLQGEVVGYICGINAREKNRKSKKDKEDMIFLAGVKIGFIRAIWKIIEVMDLSVDEKKMVTKWYIKQLKIWGEEKETWLYK